MEFTLDIPAVRAILEEEYAQVREDLGVEGVLYALLQSQRRHDARIAAAPDARTLACRAGCTWCCHFTVDVRPVEVFAIWEFLERAVAPKERARILAEVRDNSATLESLDEGERVTRNLKCPFLAGRTCAIYAVRPQSCRNYHATDVAGCEQSFLEPENLDIDPDFAPGVYQAGTAHVEAFNRALRDAGYDVKAYELNGALAAALSVTDARARFEARLAPFVGLEGEDVVEEFDDLAEE